MRTPKGPETDSLVLARSVRGPFTVRLVGASKTGSGLHKYRRCSLLVIFFPIFGGKLAVALAKR